MELHANELESGIRFIRLIGRLDTAGVKDIAAKLTAYCQGESLRLVTDLAEVEWVAPEGIRFLKSLTQSILERRGKVVFLNPTPGVKAALEKAGIPSSVPVYSSLESAETVLRAA